MKPHAPKGQRTLSDIVRSVSAADGNGPPPKVLEPIERDQELELPCVKDVAAEAATSPGRLQPLLLGRLWTPAGVWELSRLRCPRAPQMKRWRDREPVPKDVQETQ
eukprot:1155397-Pelagomonas_calceolata.AAC.8